MKYIKIYYEFSNMLLPTISNKELEEEFKQILLKNADLNVVQNFKIEVGDLCEKETENGE